MIQDSYRALGQTMLMQSPMFPQPMKAEVCSAPVDLLMDSNTGTLVWCEKVPSLRDLLAATCG
jgi:hypothetical protein